MQAMSRIEYELLRQSSIIRSLAISLAMDGGMFYSCGGSVSRNETSGMAYPLVRPYLHDHMPLPLGTGPGCFQDIG